MAEDKKILSSKVKYWTDSLNGDLEGQKVTDVVLEPEETPLDEDPNGFEKFMAQYRARESDFEEENGPDIRMGNQSPKSLEKELEEKPEFHNNLRTFGSNDDQNEGLEQLGISLPESYGGLTEPQLAGYDAQNGLEGPNVGYQGPSSNGNGNYLN